MSARYLVGCDGAGGTVRRTLGIPLDGQGTIARSVNIFFRSPGFMEMHDKGWARFLPLFRRGRVLGRGDRDRRQGSCGGSRCLPIPEPDTAGDGYLRKLAGRDFDYEILDVFPLGPAGLRRAAVFAAGGC